MAQGIITTKHGKRYLFRDDHAHGVGVWAWCIDDKISDKMVVHKWGKLPDGVLLLFNLDNPPWSVPYIPALGD